MLTSRRSAKASPSSSGVDRRFQQRGAEQGITVIDDYGHHPTEIRATLAAARECKFGRILAIFQPHRYTRTLHLMDDFARAFHTADAVFVLDIYAASEKPIAGVTAEALVERMKAFGHRGAEYAGTIENAVSSHCRNRPIRRCRHDSRCRERLAGRRPGSAATSR